MAPSADFPSACSVANITGGAPCPPPPAFCLFSKQGLALEPWLALELTVLLLQLLDAGTEGKCHHALLRHSIGSRAGSGSLLINVPIIYIMSFIFPMKKVTEGFLPAHVDIDRWKC